MRKYNAKNERIKKEYFEWEKEAKGKSISSIDKIRQAIDRYERYTQFKDFNTFNKNQAVGFKNHLAKKDLSKSTKCSIIHCLKNFFAWLGREPGYKSKVNFSHIEFLSLSEKETRAGKSVKMKNIPTLEQIKYVINRMPSKTEIDRRNRALIAFTAITGIRDGAIASLKLKHIRLEKNLVEQLPNEVKTKFSKTIYTYLLPVDNEMKQIFHDWIIFLREKKLYGENDPAFPKTAMSLDQNNEYVASGVEPIHWQTATPIRKIFKEAFKKTGILYCPPHRFRDMLENWASENCKIIDEYKAFSLNLGHEHILTTLTSYGYIDPHKQGEIIKQIGSEPSTEHDHKLDEIFNYIKKGQKND